MDMNVSMASAESCRVPLNFVEAGLSGVGQPSPVQRPVVIHGDEHPIARDFLVIVFRSGYITVTKVALPRLTGYVQIFAPALDHR